MVHSLLPLFMVSALGASALAIGSVEGAVEQAGNHSRVAALMASVRMYVSAHGAPRDLAVSLQRLCSEPTDLAARLVQLNAVGDTNSLRQSFPLSR